MVTSQKITATDRAHYDDLIVQIAYHDAKYHRDDAPEITDAEYDALRRELNAIEAEHPDWVGGASPSRMVGSAVSEKFKKITGTDQLNSVLEGIQAVLDAGFSEIKVNAVLLGGWNDNEYQSFLDWVRTQPIVLRWIELMPTGQNLSLFGQHHVKGAQIREKLLAEGWQLKLRGDADGPAQEFFHPQYRGRIGIIAPYAKDFCATCNRLRISSQGGLRLCLFGEGNFSIRELLQRPEQKEAIKARVFELLQKKEISHYLPEGRYGINNTFSSIGG